MPESPAVTDGATELFRLAALRAPEPVPDFLLRIPLGPIPDPIPQNPKVVDDNGRLMDLYAYNIGEEGTLSLGKLNDQLITQDDLWEPQAVLDWILQTTGRTLEFFVSAEVGLNGHRLVAHAQLQQSLLPGGDVPMGRYTRPTSLLRLTRLLALLNELALIPDADAVRLVLRLSQVVLAPGLLSPPADRLARPPAVADLKIVRLGPARYEAGPIAHIENVMASEKRERTFRVREENETTVELETTRREEQEKDLTTSSQVQMQQEAMRQLHTATEMEAGLQVSASYGPTVSVSADGRVARSDSRDETSRTAASYSNAITQTARQRIVEERRELRTSRHLVQTEETNLHGFNNQQKDSQHIRGVYRHVEQVQDAWIENYGKRLMLEFIVPEPAAMISWAGKAESDSWAADEPEWPTKPGPDPKPPAKKPRLSPADINENNYLELVAQYGADGVKAPPPPSIELAVAASAEANGDWGFKDDSMVVPDGYSAVDWSTMVVTWGDGKPDHRFAVGVGNARDKKNETAWPVWLGGPGENGDPTPIMAAGGTCPAEEKSKIPVVMFAHSALKPSASVRVHCVRTVDHLNNWKLQTYGRLMDAYKQAHQEWQAGKARAEAIARAAESGSGSDMGSPEANRIAERQELRRIVIEMLSGKPQDQGDFAGEAVTRPKDSRPEIHMDVVAKERDGIAFYEQALEWGNMTWVHYPYYWADRTLWQKSIRRSGGDSAWDAFLSAGASRVVAPVRPGFESAMTLFLATGVMWSGGTVPTVGDSAYLAIAEEVAETIGAKSDLPTDRVALEPVRLPTPLIWLQTSGELDSTPTKEATSAIGETPNSSFFRRLRDAGDEAVAASRAKS